MRNLEVANHPIDPVTVEAELARGEYRAVTPADLVELTLHVPTVDNAIEYARQVRNASLGRRIRLAISELLRHDPHDGAELLSMGWAAQAKLNEDQPEATRSIDDLVRQRFKQLEERAKCVVGLYRGSVYGDPVKGIDWDPTWGPGHDHEPSRQEFETTAQLCVPKNSNGRTGIVFADWRGPTTRIS